MSTNVVAIWVRRRALACWNVCSSTPSLATSLEPVVGGDQRVAVVDDGLVGARPADPERSGRSRRRCRAPRRHAGRSPAGPAPSATPVARCAATSPTTSPASTACSRQRQVRLAHTSTVGVPAIGRSRTSTRRRPLPGRPDAAVRAPRPIRRRLHREPQLTIAVHVRGDGEAVHAHQRDRAQPSSLPFPTSEASHLQMSAIRRMTRPPTSRGGPRSTGTHHDTPPAFNA